MPRSRKRHRQAALDFRTWGGRRAGAGRPQVNERKSQPHRTRPRVSPSNVIHVSLRVAEDVSRLRRRDAYSAVRKAMQVVLGRADFRIVHASIQANHVHLLGEADHKYALARGLQAFQISAAKRLNQAQERHTGERRSGRVFPDRYHAEIIDTPRRARHALAYVLNNWRRHREDRAPGTRTWKLDRYSSAIDFPGWDEGSKWLVPDDHERLPVCTPQTWLLREGWKMHGTLSVYEVPGKR